MILLNSLWILLWVSACTGSTRQDEKTGPSDCPKKIPRVLVTVPCLNVCLSPCADSELPTSTGEVGLKVFQEKDIRSQNVNIFEFFEIKSKKNNFYYHYCFRC